jgi:hypothetical protein
LDLKFRIQKGGGKKIEKNKKRKGKRNKRRLGWGTAFGPLHRFFTTAQTSTSARARLGHCHVGPSGRCRMRALVMGNLRRQMGPRVSHFRSFRMVRARLTDPWDLPTRSQPHLRTPRPTTTTVSATGDHGGNTGQASTPGAIPRADQHDLHPWTPTTIMRH